MRWNKKYAVKFKEFCCGCCQCTAWMVHYSRTYPLPALSIGKAGAQIDEQVLLVTLLHCSIAIRSA